MNKEKDALRKEAYELGGMVELDTEALRRQVEAAAQQVRALEAEQVAEEQPWLGE